MKYLDREADIENKIITSPENAQELINTISKFKGIIAGRLHANIIGYSLGIPSIGIVWNNKCKLWGETIGYPERFFEINKFIPQKIVNQCLQSIEEGYQKTNRKDLIET